MVKIETFKKTIADKFGFEVSDYRQSYLQNVIGERSLKNSFDCHDSYIDWLQKDIHSPEWSQVIDALTIKETYFFRNPRQFGYLKDTIIPKLEKSRFRWTERPTLRILSAACSTGEEAYSIAMTMMDALPNHKSWNIQIDAFDISAQALETARSGLYPATGRLHESVRAVNPDYEKIFFEETASTNVIAVKPEVRSTVRFYQANLKEQLTKPAFMLPRYDVIFCRNVMIYFSLEDQSSLVRWLENSLEDGGYLFLGDAETLHLYKHDMKMIDGNGALIYQKPSQPEIYGN